jgi:hypothetical protein
MRYLRAREPSRSSVIAAKGRPLRAKIPQPPPGPLPRLASPPRAEIGPRRARPDPKAGAGPKAAA